MGMGMYLISIGVGKRGAPEGDSRSKHGARRAPCQTRVKSRQMLVKSHQISSNLVKCSSKFSRALRQISSTPSTRQIQPHFRAPGRSGSAPSHPAAPDYAHLRLSSKSWRWKCRLLSMSRTEGGISLMGDPPNDGVFRQITAARRALCQIPSKPVKTWTPPGPSVK